LPAIRDVKVLVASEARARALRRAEIYVNDGTLTELKFKGDGVQSLAAIALMRHTSERSASGKHVIVAVEEPESHLHPAAIHGLRSVMRDLAQQQQIVITTHCPLFVDRANVEANIVVNKNKARVAKHIQEVRDILGVRASDNLRHAELVLVVEGEEDRLAIGSLLPALDAQLKSAIEEGTIAIDTLGGGSNLTYKLGLLRDSLCSYHCLLDYDKAGRDAFAKAKAEGLLGEANVTFTTCNGCPDSEIEDLYETDLYKQMVFTRYGVNLESPKFRSNRKWTERMRDTFKQQGKDWNDLLENEVKHSVASLVVASPELALNSHRRASLDALAEAIRFHLDNHAKSPTIGGQF
jgi:putative ATP-dependent endonuclease of the OLD family